LIILKEKIKKYLQNNLKEIEFYISSNINVNGNEAHPIWNYLKLNSVLHDFNTKRVYVKKNIFLKRKKLKNCIIY
jgi:glutathione peroxidase-family protein